ncbi:unnamed protein product [Caenorhabditis brenneri]
MYDDLVDFEFDKKVTMLFKLRIAATSEILLKMVDEVDVKVDRFQRITDNKAKRAGGLTLYFSASQPRQKRIRYCDKRMFFFQVFCLCTFYETRIPAV